MGPVEGMRRAYLMEGKPPGGGPSWIMGMSLTDCKGAHIHTLAIDAKC